MSVHRKALLTSEEENGLKTKMLALHKQGYRWYEIANMLEFGVSGTTYEKLLPEYIHYYRWKFKLPKIREKKNYPHRYKMGKQEEIMSEEEFKKIIENISEKGYHGKERKLLNILYYWSGLRVREIISLTINDFEVTEEFLVVKATREKKGRGKENPVMPVYLHKDWYGIKKVIDFIEKLKEKNLSGKIRPFPIHRSTAWRWVSEHFKGKYPHYYRLNRLTEFCDDPETTIPEIKAWFDITATTIDKYLSSHKKYAERLARRRSKKVEKSFL